MQHFILLLTFDYTIPKAFFKIRVRDQGIGCETKYANRIFEVFQRLQAKGQYEGTRIGLAICNKIAENHKGFMEADSAVGKGSVFRLYLPAALII